jgi:hypothetical protein
LTRTENHSRANAGVRPYPASGYRCDHSVTIDASQWPDDVRLSDLEPKSRSSPVRLAGTAAPMSGRCSWSTSPPRGIPPTDRSNEKPGRYGRRALHAKPKLVGTALEVGACNPRRFRALARRTEEPHEVANWLFRESKRKRPKIGTSRLSLGCWLVSFWRGILGEKARKRKSRLNGVF